jgi:serine/threonine protein kinase
MTLTEAIRRVRDARTGEELFGTADPVGEYRRLVRLLHPDRVDAPHRDAATHAFVEVTTRWRERRDPVILRTGGAEYRLGRLRYAGDLTDVYDAGNDRLVKLPRDPTNNDLMAREASALARIAGHGDPRYLPYVPRLVDSFRHREANTGADRRVNVVAAAGGLRSLVEVRRAYPDGLDPRDAAWIWRRLLVALGLAHRAGVVHGAVVPDHVLIEPDEHGVVLVDWCYSVTGPDDRVPALVPAYAAWYPPEVPDREAPGPGTDIAMAARCMAYLIATHMPRALRAFVHGCLQPSTRHRPDDAWRLLGELDDVLERRYGPHTFRPFTL